MTQDDLSTADAARNAPDAPDPPDASNAPDEPEVLDDGTLGGYLDAHDRPPAFEGDDGHPYTVAVEVEKVGDLRAPYAAYLVFPRWARNGMGIVGHVQTPLLGQAPSRDAARRIALELGLVEVKELLDAAVEEAPEPERRW